MTPPREGPRFQPQSSQNWQDSILLQPSLHSSPSKGQQLSNINSKLARPLEVGGQQSTKLEDRLSGKGGSSTWGKPKVQQTEPSKMCLPCSVPQNNRNRVPGLICTVARKSMRIWLCQDRVWETGLRRVLRIKGSKENQAPLKRERAPISHSSHTAPQLVLQHLGKNSPLQWRYLSSLCDCDWVSHRGGLPTAHLPRRYVPSPGRFWTLALEQIQPPASGLGQSPLEKW